MAIDPNDLKATRLTATRTAILLGPSLATIATMAIWLDLPGLDWFAPQQPLFAASLAALVLWLLVLVAAHHHARTTSMRDAIRAVQELNLDPAAAAPNGPTPGFTYLPGALILAMSMCAAIGLWLDPNAMIWTTRWQPLGSLELAGTTATALIWIAGITALFRARAVRRMAAEYAAFIDCEESARDAVEVIPVLISVSRLDGRRTQFNRTFIDITGKTEEELRGHGWLGCVHAEDRERLTELEAIDAGRSMEIEYGLFAKDGRNRWVRETLVPRTGDDGKVDRFIATGVDVTRQVETDTANQDAIGKLSATVDDLRIEHREAIERLETEHAQALEALGTERTEELERLRERHESTLEELRARHKEELGAQTSQQKTDHGELKKSLAAASKAKERLEAKLAQSSEDARRSTDEAGELRRQAAEAKAELQAALADRKHAEVESRKLQESVEKLQALVDKLESEEKELRAERERTVKMMQGAKVDADEVNRSQSELRAKVRRLTERVQGLESELDTVRTDHAQALDEIAQHESATAEVVAERNRELAAELRPQLQAVIDISRRLHDCAVDESQLSALEGAQASAAAMARLVETALGSESEGVETTQAPQRAFDLREAVRNVAAQLDGTAREQGASIRCAVHSEFPSRVIGDPVGVREVLIHSVRSGLAVVGDGTLHVSLAPSGRTSSHVAARIEIREETGQYDRAALNQRFGLDEDASGIGAAAASAWALVREREGTYGLDIPGHGGFVLWITLNLARHAEAAPAMAHAAPPVPVAAAASVSSPAPIVSSAPAPAPAATPSDLHRLDADSAGGSAITAPMPAIENAPPAPDFHAPAPTPGSASTAAPTSTPPPVHAQTPMIQQSVPNAASSMTPAPVSQPTAPAPLAPRVPQEDLRCNLGDIVELGCDSARILCRQAPQGPIEIRIESEDGTLEIAAELVTHEPDGRQESIVVRFTDAVMPDLRRRVLQLAMAHRREAGLDGRSLSP